MKEELAECGIFQQMAREDVVLIVVRERGESASTAAQVFRGTAKGHPRGIEVVIDEMPAAIGSGVGGVDKANIANIGITRIDLAELPVNEAFEVGTLAHIFVCRSILKVVFDSIIQEAIPGC